MSSLMNEEKSKPKTNTHKDYYAILKVRSDYSTEQIEDAYYKLYEKYGPNAPLDGKSAEEVESSLKMYQEITDAFEVLSNQLKREEYDRQMERRKQQSGDVRALWSKVTSFGSSGSNSSAGETESKQPKIQALAYEVQAEITLKEAIKGTKFSFTIADPTPCEDCAGLKPVNRMQCPTCRGLGYFNVDREEELTLPPNMFEGMEIRKPELGRYDLRAQHNGDLIIKIRIKPHPSLTILGNDLLCNVPLSLYEAILGAEIQIPTATGKGFLKVQPLTQPGRIYRLKGLGLGGGDQLVKIEVVLPQKLSGEEVALFKKLRESYKEPNPRELMGK